MAVCLALPDCTLGLSYVRSRRRWAITSWPTYACPNAQPGAHRAAAAAAKPATGAAQVAATRGVQPYGSTLDGVRTIVRQEGVMALWRGTSASLLMARACQSRRQPVAYASKFPHRVQQYAGSSSLCNTSH